LTSDNLTPEQPLPPTAEEERDMVDDGLSFSERLVELQIALDEPSHMLCRAIQDAAFAFKISYRSAGCHRRLLPSAVAEVCSVTDRLDQLVATLYPEMKDALNVGTVRVFRQKVTLEDAIGSHACSLEANTRVTNGISLGSSLLLPVDTVNCVQTLKAQPTGMMVGCLPQLRSVGVCWNRLCTVLMFGQKWTLEDAICSHA
jgi:hypothetical protein